MLNDYKPTHDPNTDTFKVQYLLGFSALLALLFPHDYSVSEVFPLEGFYVTLYLTLLDSLDVLYMARVRGYLAPTFHASAHWGGRHHNDTLSFRFGIVSRPLHP